MTRRRRLEAAPHWHMGKHITKCPQRSCWSIENRLRACVKVKRHHFEHLLK